MAKGRTKSKLTLSQRRERSFELFARGYTNKDVASVIGVSEETAGSYRRLYNERLHAQAASNPGFLRDVLTNTMRALEELDQIRADAWKHLENRTIKELVECPDCGAEHKVKFSFPVSDQSRAQYHNVLLKAQDQRSKLFGVLGVKQEFFIAIMQVKVVQDKLLEWMAQNLCADDREALANFMQTELSEYMGGPAQAFDVIDVPALEEAS
jgi:DNA-binding CsgD family transcriptional regulator